MEREEEANATQDDDRKKKQENDIQEWILYKTRLGGALQQPYPLSKQQTKPAEPELVTRQAAWARRRKSPT